MGISRDYKDLGRIRSISPEPKIILGLMERILQHVKPERRKKELERNPVHPLFWKRSFHIETLEQAISRLIPVFSPILKLSGLYQRGFQNALDLRKTELMFVDPTLPSAFEGFKILFLSDLHFDGNDCLLEVLCAVLDTVDADICLLGGDYRFRIHGPFRTVIDRFQEMVRHVRTRHGILGILGNHDSWEMIKPMERLGITMLINESVQIQHGSESIWILGLDDPHYYECDDYPKASHNIPANAFRVLLVHATDILPRLNQAPIHLCLCGHTHAGQISLPIIGPPITHSKLRGEYVYGSWRYGAIKGYTTSGAGTSGWPIRFNTHSEVAVITLRSK